MRRDWLRERARRGTEAAMETLAEASRRRAPRDTGALQASIRAEREPGKTRGRVVCAVPYARRRHEDTRLPRHGFLSGAVRDPAAGRDMLRAAAKAMRTD